MRVLAEFLCVENRPGQDAGSLEGIHGLDLGPLTTPRGQQCINLGSVSDALFGICKTRIIDQVLLADGAEQTLPLFIVGCRSADKAVIVRAPTFAAVELVWRSDTGQAAITAALWR